jgi:hypothetical protein
MGSLYDDHGIEALPAGSYQCGLQNVNREDEMLIKDDRTGRVWGRRVVAQTLALGLFAFAVVAVADDNKSTVPFNARKAPVKAVPSGGQTAVSAAAVKVKKVPAFRFEGEELYYGVEISGSDAARASIRVGKRQKVRGVTYVPVAAKAITHGFFAKSYPVDNKADTFINVNTLQPIKSDKVIREKGESRVYKVRYDPGAYSVRVDKEMKKGKRASKKTYERPVPATIHDGLSWMYELRMEPLKKGDVYTYYIYDGWKLSRLKVTVMGKKSKVWTPLKSFDTIKVDIERTILNASWPKGSRSKSNPRLTSRAKPYYFSTIFLSDDEARVPVRIFVTSKTADSELKLVKYVPGK